MEDDILSSVKELLSKYDDAYRETVRECREANECGMHNKFSQLMMREADYIGFIQDLRNIVDKHSGDK